MKRAITLDCLLAMPGCVVTNKALRGNYTNYNETIAYNQSQYRETPVFLKVGALSASYDFTARAGGGVVLSGSDALYDFDIGPSFSSRPTITYTPIEGNTFVKQVLAEVDQATFVLLLRSGWSVRTLAHIMVERIGPYVNNEEEASDGEFKAFADLLRRAQKDDELQFVTHDGEVVLMTPPGREEFHLPWADDPEHLHVIPLADFQLRSLMDIMFFLGKNTKVPDGHQDFVKESPPNGWISIHSSKGRPGTAMVAVKHHGHYFSIDSADIQSKDTFALLKLLFQIQAGDIKSMQPILTLPVATP